MKKFIQVSDFKSDSSCRVPKMFYDYVDGGSHSEYTYKKNYSDFDQISINQRVGIDISKINTSTKLFNESISIPICLAPTGLAGMLWADGEILAAKAAEAYGSKFVLSTMSICSIEDIARNTSASFWFQLYVMKDREFALSLLKRAAAVGCDALVLTLDLQALATRPKDIQNGLSVPPDFNINTLVQLLSKPSWCMSMLKANRRTFGNLTGYVNKASNISELASWASEQFDPSFTWDDIKWIRDNWNGKLILKGIMSALDVSSSISIGADAIVVSNHGGRQLDGAASTISILPSIVKAVDNAIPVHFDGGIDSGHDVFRALSLGASNIYIGRSYLYGLASAGQEGVVKVLEILNQEFSQAMAFSGCNSINDIDSTKTSHSL